jgi:hypothetical protein
MNVKVLAEAAPPLDTAMFNPSPIIRAAAAFALIKLPSCGDFTVLAGLSVQAIDTLRRVWRKAKLRPTKPSSIIPQVEGSGTGSHLRCFQKD